MYFFCLHLKTMTSCVILRFEYLPNFNGGLMVVNCLIDDSAMVLPISLPRAAGQVMSAIQWRSPRAQLYNVHVNQQALTKDITAIWWNVRPSLNTTSNFISGSWRCSTLITFKAVRVETATTSIFYMWARLDLDSKSPFEGFSWRLLRIHYALRSVCIGN